MANKTFLVVASGGPEALSDARRTVEAKGGRITHSYGGQVFVAEGPAAAARAAAERSGVAVYDGVVPDSAVGELDEAGRLGAAGWNLRQAGGGSKAGRKGEGLSWDHPGYEPEG